MKKLSFVLALVLTACLLCTTALADVLYTPEDDFLEEHFSDFQFNQRSYYANGETGYLELFSKPGGSSLGFAQNGEPFFVTGTYVDAQGVEWGVVEYEKDIEYLVGETGSGLTGYIKMADTLPVYDYISFKEDHGDSFTEYDGDYSELDGGFVAWSFPYSGVVVNTWHEGPEDDGMALDFTEVYTGEDGRQWGFAGYYFGLKNFWVCFSDPTNADIPADFPSTAFIMPTSGDTPQPTAPSSGINITAIAIALVAVVIALTLILVLRKKKDDKAE